MPFAYKFLIKTGEGCFTSWKGHHYWIPGRWYSLGFPLAMCSHGFHACKNLRDLFSYIHGNSLAIVEYTGKILKDKNKICAARMRVVTEVHGVHAAFVAYARWCHRFMVKELDGDGTSRFKARLERCNHAGRSITFIGTARYARDVSQEMFNILRGHRFPKNHLPERRSLNRWRARVVRLQERKLRELLLLHGWAS